MDIKWTNINISTLNLIVRQAPCPNQKVKNHTMKFLQDPALTACCGSKSQLSSASHSRYLSFSEASFQIQSQYMTKLIWCYGTNHRFIESDNQTIIKTWSLFWDFWFSLTSMTGPKKVYRTGLNTVKTSSLITEYTGLKVL